MNRPLLKLGAAAGVLTLSTLSVGPAMAATNDIGFADASASTGSGQLFEALDTGACTSQDTASTDAATPAGRCGDGLNLNDQIKAFSQTASAPGNGNSKASASVAPINIVDFTSLDLTGIIGGLEAIDTGTALDTVIKGVTGPTGELLKPLKDSAIDPINDAVQEALSKVYDAAPLSLALGAVESRCEATSSPPRATGNGTVADIALKVKLGDQVVSVPITAETSPNSNLLIGAPHDLADDVIQGLRDTFTDSLGGSLKPLNDVLDTFQEQVTDQIFDELEDQVLPQLAAGLAPLIKGTVNAQQPASPSATGEIEVAALDLTLGGDQNLKLARTHCGPNGRVAAPQPGPKPNTPAVTPALPDVPTKVTSGQAGDDDTTATTVLAATAALLAMAGSGTAAYRRLRIDHR